MNIAEIVRIPGRRATPAALSPAHRGRTVAAVAAAVFLGARLTAAPWPVSTLAVWDAAALAWLILTSLALGTAHRAAAQAEPAGAGRPAALAAATVAALLGIVAALAFAGEIGRPRSAEEGLRVGLAMTAVVGAWLLVRAESRLHCARLRRQAPGREPGGAAAPTPNPAQLGFWEFVYYAFPIARCDDRADPQAVTPAMCRVAVLHSVVMVTSLVVLFAFALSLVGPALDSVRFPIGG